MRSSCRLLALLTLLTVTLFAQIEPRYETEVARKIFSNPALYIPNHYRPVNALASEIRDQVASRAQDELQFLNIPQENGFFDARSNRWGSLILSQPLLPGDGFGNAIRWSSLGRSQPKGLEALKESAWEALMAFLQSNENVLGINVLELPEMGSVAVHDHGNIIQLVGWRHHAGMPVRQCFLTATINHGNLILLGLRNWGEIELNSAGHISETDAIAALGRYIGKPVSDFWDYSSLQIQPLAAGDLDRIESLGRGYDYRLVWVIRPKYQGESPKFEALVDATSGEVLALEDTNHYFSGVPEVKGGVYPVSNDGVAPDGQEQAGWPMPFADVKHNGITYHADAGGNLGRILSGTVTTELNGTYVKMQDVCGALSESGESPSLDLGTSGGTDCTVPNGASAGNTHASRSGYYELNRTIAMARSHLPDNTWLQSKLTANMNINNTCNANWNGSAVNFFKSGDGCSNTGELAGVFDHEWGHGMDDNDVQGGIANPGEGIADIYAALRLNDSCMGRNFTSSPCGGSGDPCTECTGVRDIDYAKRASGLPHTINWIDANCGSGPAPCGGGVHCEGAVYAEAVWDLYNRDLPSLYGMSIDTAREVTTNLTFIGAGAVGTWYQCVSGQGGDGCNADGGYLNYLAADDDNGNLADGTPHMTAIQQAFNRHLVACGTPAVLDGGCANRPSEAPSVQTTALDRSVSLTWTPVTSAVRYKVYQTDGVFACDFGKEIVGETTETSLTLSGLQNNRTYSYIVAAFGSSDSCMGPASACASVIPVPGANLAVASESFVGIVLGGDEDLFIDNCEAVRVNFAVHNIGGLALNNVRLTSVTAQNAPNLTILNPYPETKPSTLEVGEIGIGDFAFFAAELTSETDLVFDVEVDADGLPAPIQVSVAFSNNEGDFTFQGNVNYSFENGSEGWTTTKGTFQSATTFGAAPGSGTHAMVSSSSLDDQCDQVRSPRFHLNSDSTLAMFTNYDTEDFSSGSWWDRANVALYELASGTRQAIAPDGGLAYEASGAGGNCESAGDVGWAGPHPTWERSTWSASVLQGTGFGTNLVQLDVTYGTDSSVSGTGFRFDQVVLTNVDVFVTDSQSNSCATNQAPVAEDDSFAVQEAQFLDVLENDSDSDQDALHVLLVGPPSHGAASIVASNGVDYIYYVPGPDYQGEDSFEYLITDGKGSTSTATVALSSCSSLASTYPTWPQFSILNMINCINQINPAKVAVTKMASQRSK